MYIQIVLLFVHLHSEHVSHGMVDAFDNAAPIAVKLVETLFEQQDACIYSLRDFAAKLCAVIGQYTFTGHPQKVMPVDENVFSAFIHSAVNKML